LDIYQNEGLLTRARDMAGYWEEEVHAPRGCKHVKDIRNYGLVAGIEREPMARAPGKRAYELFVRCFEKGALIRVTGDIIALSPPLIIEREQIDQLFNLLQDVLQAQA
ncbi:aspartate aminotransferase family protein, partial [Aeromonas salmonicida]|uniref:aminotransferase class III-fold pyridoxal phosphate-dependent enzyme n=1 Tax=Aeromonas salmonicida TaxID=645 RepID=UPI00111AADFC